MLDEKLKQTLEAVGVQGIDENTKHEDLPKILKQNKKVLKAHDDLAAAVADGPTGDEDPETKETTPTPPAPAPTGQEKKTEEVTKTPEEPPKVPTATPVTPAPAAEPSTPRKFGKAFPDRK